MSKIFLNLMFIFVVACGLAYIGHLHSRASLWSAGSCESLKEPYLIAHGRVLREFTLMDPEQAPAAINSSVMRGYNLFLHTAYYAPHYAKNELSCCSCHFTGGNTLGGINGGISLVGVTKIYPQYSERDKKTISLTERINNCFRRSLNGVPPPENSREMYDLVNYIKWISAKAEKLDKVTWLGLNALKSTHKPDAQEGHKLYLQFCAACHQVDGSGGGNILTPEDGKAIPPLWGPNSFNDGAGMNNIKKLAPFIYLNMPYQQAALSESEALDVAAYLISQPRPQFNP